MTKPKQTKKEAEADCDEEDSAIGVPGEGRVRCMRRGRRKEE